MPRLVNCYGAQSQWIKASHTLLPARHELSTTKLLLVTAERNLAYVVMSPPMTRIPVNWPGVFMRHPTRRRSPMVLRRMRFLPNSPTTPGVILALGPPTVVAAQLGTPWSTIPSIIKWLLVSAMALHGTIMCEIRRVTATTCFYPQSSLSMPTRVLTDGISRLPRGISGTTRPRKVS